MNDNGTRGSADFAPFHVVSHLPLHTSHDVVNVIENRCKAYVGVVSTPTHKALLGYAIVKSCVLSRCCDTMCVTSTRPSTAPVIEVRVVVDLKSSEYLSLPTVRCLASVSSPCYFLANKPACQIQSD